MIDSNTTETASIVIADALSDQTRQLRRIADALETLAAMQFITDLTMSDDTEISIYRQVLFGRESVSRAAVPS